MPATSLIHTIRLPFLILTPVCIFLGLSIAIKNQTPIDYFIFSLALIGAMLAHISVNTFNEYFDFKSGLDLMTHKTPFSGGSGVLPLNPKLHHAVYRIAIISLLACISIGIFFIWKFGITIFFIGIVGIAIILSYTTWINQHPLLCLFAPGIGFGFLFVTGTQFVLNGEFTPLSWWLSVIPFLLVNNLLLLNQYPDIEADKQVGRYHFPIAFGVKNANWLFGFFNTIAIIIIFIYVTLGILPTLSLLALAPLSLGFYTLYGAMKYQENIGKHPKYLSANVATTLLTPFLLGLSLVLN